MGKLQDSILVLIWLIVVGKGSLRMLVTRLSWIRMMQLSCPYEGPILAWLIIRAVLLIGVIGVGVLVWWLI